MNKHKTANSTRSQNSLTTHVARALALSISLALLAVPVLAPNVVMAVLVMALLGNLIGMVAGRSRLRAPIFFASAVLISAVAAVLIHEANRDASGDPKQLFTWLEYATFGIAALIVSAVLRFLGMRWRTASLVEAIVPVIAFVQLFIAHRDGSIHRPYALSDPILAMGWDPVPIFLAFGAVATLIMLWSLMRSASFVRSAFHLAVLLGFLFLVMSVVQQFGLPRVPDQPWSAGLRPDEKQSKGNGRGQSRPPSQRSSPPDFSSGNNESGSNAPVAVVVFHDDYEPTYGVYYFRQGAYSQFNGRRLVASTLSNVDNDLINPFTSTKEVAIPQAPNEAPYRQTVTTEVALISEHYQPFGLEAPVASREEPNPNPNRFRQFYEVRSHALVADGSMLVGHHAGNPNWSQALWKHYTEFPSDPRYAELAQKIVSPLSESMAQDPFVEALLISKWLSEQGTYSFMNQHEYAEDPASSFLFGDLTGYCVHFAHAAVYLMRSLGLPARVANGYAVDASFRRGGSSLLISGAYAHAWPELYLDDVGWVIVDVSPKRSLVPPPEPMDQDLQQLMGEIARGNTGREEDQARWNNYLVTARKMTVQYGLILAWTVLILTLFFYAVKLWRAWFPWFAPVSIFPTAMYRASLDRLSEVSLSRSWGESREAFAERLAPQLPAFGGVTTAHLAQIFAADSRAVDRRALVERARQFRREIRASQPWWKRWLGALLPWSWIRSR